MRQITIIVDDCANIKENQLNSDALYPNPSKGTFTFSKITDGSRVEVYSIDGKCIYNKLISNQDSWISINDAESGIYNVKLKLSNSEKNFKLIISTY